MAKAKKLPSGKWRTQVYLGKDAAGKPIMESFTAPTARESERLAAIAAAERKRKEQQSITLGRAMDEFINTCRVQGYSPSTIPAYISIRKNSFPALVNVRVDRITVNDIQTAVDARAKNHSPKTVRNDFYFVRSVMEKYAPNLDLRNITLAKRKKQKKRLFSESWAYDVLQYAHSHFEPDFYLYCCFTISAGLRPSETYALTWGDLSAEPLAALTPDGKTFKMGMLNVEKASVRDENRVYVGKGTKTEAGERVLRLDWSFFAAVYDAKPHGRDTERILTLKPNLVPYRWKKMKEALSLPDKMRFYDLRHVFATSVAYSGASEEELASALGHSTSAFSHQVYVEMFRERQESVNAKMATGTAALYNAIQAGK